MSDTQRQGNGSTWVASLKPKKRIRVKKARRSRMATVLLVLLALGVAGGIGGGITLYLASQDLPDITGLNSYRPLLPLRIYSMDGEQIGEYGEQVRDVVPVERIPELLKQAFVATEDTDFYGHFGVSPMAILRAAYANLKAGRVVQGGSTITQQLAKTFFLTPQQTFMRKAREALLAIHMERNMTKDEILWLYCNQIYMGHGAYGVSVAARNYFDKRLEELNLAEIAYLAGLPKAPSTYSPYAHPKQAKERQNHVLRRMAKERFITPQQMEDALATQVKIHPTPDSHVRYAPYYAEQVRRDLMARSLACIHRFAGDPPPPPTPSVEEVLKERKPLEFGKPVSTPPITPTDDFCQALKPVYDDILSGEEKYRIQEDKSLEETLIYRSGFSVETAAEVAAEIRAQDAVLYGLKRITRRMGFAGPLGHLEKGDRPRFLEAMSKRIPDAGKLRRDGLYLGMVTDVDDKGKTAMVRIGAVRAPLYLADNSWAREPKPELSWEYDRLRDLRKALKPGDLILVRPSDAKNIEKYTDFRSLDPLPEDTANWRLDLMQLPFSQASLMSKNVDTGYVVAMVGGWNYEESQYNRPVQSCRQPGSAFKPIVYTTALEKGWTPATIIVDSPVVTEDENMRWTPDNFGGSFKGDTPLVKGLAHSMNICAIKALEYAGIADTIAWARRLGISTTINFDFSIALGSSCVSMDELINAYMHFPRLGVPQRTITIRVIRDAHGRIIEDNRDPADPWLPAGPEVFDRLRYQVEHPLPQVLPQTTAYIMLSLMQQVVLRGTAGAANSLGRPLAGKTGTTNDSFDAWFMGYSPDLVTGAWIGFDENERHLGRNETGGSAALPIWMDFMEHYLHHGEVKEFPPPPSGIEFRSIDFDTGLLSGENTMTSVRLPFVLGTSPTTTSTVNDDIDPEEVLQGGGPL